MGPNTMSVLMRCLPDGGKISGLLGLCLLLTVGLSGCNKGDAGQALGTLERDRVALTATAAEVVMALPVAEGSMVHKGDVLVKLDDARQQAEVEHAHADVARAEANLEKLQNGTREEVLAAARARVAGAKATLVEAEQSFQRTKDLQSRGTASQASLDTAIAGRTAAEAQLQSSEENLRELENGTRPEDLAVAEAELEAARANLKIQQKVLQDLTVTASRNGKLDSLPWNLGERVSVGSPVAIIMAGTAPYARVYVPETHRVNLHLGDTLSVRIDGLKDAVEGQVSYISSDPAFTPYYALNQSERARLMYLMEVQLPESAADLPNGVPAQVVLP